jgi:hypothetical protein
MDSPRRHYAARTRVKGQLTDSDAAERAYRLKTMAYALVGGGTIGAIAGSVAAGRVGALIGLVVGFGFSYGVTALVTRAGATAAGKVYHPSGASTPPTREYSQAQSLAARGLYAEAIDAYQACGAEFPDDPEPRFRIARLYLKELKRYEDAIAWFKQARSARAIDAGRALVATQEIVDIYDHKLHQPRRAIPELARLVERFPGTAAATWAQDELRVRRARLASEVGEPGPDGR